MKVDINNKDLKINTVSLNLLIRELRLSNNEFLLLTK